MVALLRQPWPERPPLAQLEPAPSAAETQTLEAELVTFELGANGAWLERVTVADIVVAASAENHASVRYGALLEALRGALGDDWPGALGFPTLIVVGEPDEETLVLDFAPSMPVTVTVLEETRLLRALRETLARAGAERVRLLVGHRPSESFLGHLSLEQTLE